MKKGGSRKRPEGDKPNLIALPGVPGRKVVPFTKELALKFIVNAFPDAEIRVRTTEYYGVSVGIQYTVEIRTAGRWYCDSSYKSLEDAFRNAIDSKFRWQISRC